MGHGGVGKGREGAVVRRGGGTPDGRGEMRFRAAVEAVDGIVWTNDPQGRMTGPQPGWEALTGQAQDEYQGHGWAERVHPADVGPTLAAWAAAVERKRLFSFEHRVKRKDGSWGWYAARAMPVLDETGAIEEWVGIHRDITPQRQAEAALRRERDRAQHYLQIAEVMLLVLDREGRVETINRRGAEILGVDSPESLIGKDWFDTALPALERERVRTAFRRLMTEDTEPLGVFENAVIRADGEERMIAWRNTMLHDEAGRPAGTLSSGEDVTEQRAAAAKERLLSQEIDHRAKNLLGVVQAIVQLSRADTIDGFREAVSGRIDALARTHALLAESRWAGVEFGDLAGEALAGTGAGTGRVSLEGPPSLLKPAAAQAMAIILHELSINALRHGALSGEEGSLTVRWAAPAGTEGRFMLVWEERGGPKTAAPRQLGFGGAVLKASVEKQLRGRLSLDWRSGGLRCEIETPADRLIMSGPSPSRRALRILVAEPEDSEQALRDKVEAAGFAVHAAVTERSAAARLMAEGHVHAAVISAALGQAEASVLAVMARDAGVPFFFCGEERAVRDLPEGAAAPLPDPCDPRVLAAVLEVVAKQAPGG